MNQELKNKPKDIFEFFEEVKEENPNFKKECEIEEEHFECVKAFRELRKKKGLSQSDISKKSGLTQQTISRMEVYNKVPNLKTVVRYLDACGVKLSELVNNCTE